MFIEVDIVEIGDMVVNKVGINAKSALVTLKQNLKQIPIDVTPLI